ncbi:hypothetical protein STRCI_001366 [Streptomyces cinnabarinus]|uniref:Lipoprotein n=1 Tax=Streptomyces cinnabarinus TaxID=67287 RepID=A0ABY7K6Z1_9ACTN|nr:hypothetical protein [Streptomyces cinnabarinus]WAZ20263.1 hypothetical protein STRCI_001366 [Streptomyces cinnabarinus]
MHRTTTTAALLVTVAVSALSGCVTVQRPPASAPGPAPAQPSAARPQPQIVQAPALEALELIGPTRRPEPRPSTTRRPSRTPPAPAAPAAQAPPPNSPRPAAPRAERPAPQRPRVDIPDIAESVRENTDVCGLGKRYGGWRKDSPEARICERTYGR